MSIRSLFAACAALVVAAPVALRAQDENTADFVKARQQFVAGQKVVASQTLIVSSLAVRQQLGRCRDDAVGSRLIEAEGQLEKLANRVRNGQVASVKLLDEELTAVDRLLAQHHLQLAADMIAHPRAVEFPVIARDVDRGAFHFERSVTLNGQKLAAEQDAALKDARTLVKTIEDTSTMPKDAGAVVATLLKQVAGAPKVAASP